MEVTQESSLIMTQTAQQQDKVTMDYSCLPNDVWLRVMELLCPRDRYRMARTCSLFHELFQHPSFSVETRVSRPDASDQRGGRQCVPGFTQTQQAGC